MPSSRPPRLDRPGRPGAAAPMLRRSWPALAAAAVLAAGAGGLAVLSQVDDPGPSAAVRPAPRCEPLTGPLPGVRLPAGLPTLPGQFVHQTGQVDRTVLTFTAVPDPDLDAVLAQLTRALRGAGHTVTVSQPLAAAGPPAGGPAQPPQEPRRAVLAVSGPAGRGIVTVAPRCATQSTVAYVLTPR